MKLNNLFRRFFIILLFVASLYSCKNTLLPEPELLPSNGSNNSVTNATPTDLQASHGLKRSIILTWTQIPNIKRYHIYQAESQYSTFIQIGESKTNSFTVPVLSGSTYFYKITAINASEIESDFSIIVKGTSLATPEINAIEPITESLITGLQVYWYMPNVDSTTYQNDVRYNVICLNEEGVIVEEAQVNGNENDETSCSFEGLDPNTNYRFQVQAYNVNDQKNVETSISTDAKTGKLLRPKPVENLTATQGIDKDKIVLSFDLPQLVYVSLGNSTYTENKIYFKIYRREYLENTTLDFQLICSYFGENPAEGVADAVKFPNELAYETGKNVEFIDSDSTLERGRVYEYKIQSFADETTRVISSDLSFKTVRGYKMASVVFGLKNYQTEVGLIDEVERNINTTHNFNLQWNNLETEKKYTFVINERKYKLQSDNEDITDEIGTDCPQLKFVTIDEVNTYIREFDISTNELEQANRGYYKYSIDVLDSDENVQDSISAFGQILVTGDTTKPEINGFTVKDGFADSFVISWIYDSTCTYELYYVPVINGVEASRINETLPTPTINDGEIFVFKSIAEPGDSRKYILKAIRGIEVTTEPPAEPWNTLGVPVLECPTHNYDSVFVQFKPVQKATSYTLTANYKDENILVNGSNEIFTEVINSSERLTPNSNGYITSKISTSDGSFNALISGKPIVLTVTAKSDAASEDGINEIIRIIETETLGPALSSISATQANFADKIQVKFNKINGASKYIVLRKQYKTLENGSQEYVCFITYLINSENDTISLFGGLDIDISSCTTLDFNSNTNVYTIVDKHTTEQDPNNKWLIGQSVIGLGDTFTYAVIPVISENDFYYDDSLDFLTIDSTPLLNYSEPQITKQAYALGYGNYLTATKGSNPQSSIDSTMINDSIIVTWQEPKSGLFELCYNLYKRKLGDSNWSSPILLETNKYIDTEVAPGEIYEYIVGTFTKGSTISKNPTTDSYYMNFLNSQIDSKRNVKKSIGYVLPIVSMDKASREDIGVGNVDIQWYKGIFNQQIDSPFDGYVIEVLNMNIASNANDWKVLTHVPYTTTTTATARVNNDSGLLKILRDYELYFRVRPYTSYETDDGEVYTYGIAPDYTWSDGFENKYVKWGARQITIEEFAEIAGRTLGEGAYNSSCADVKESNIGYNREFIFNKNNSTTFLIPNGTMYGYATATGRKPKRYGAVCAGIWGASSGPKASTTTIEFSSKTDIPILYYSGKATITSLSNSTGTFIVEYNGQSGDYRSLVSNYFEYD